MNPGRLSHLGAAALGFAAAAVCFAAWSPRPASAQFQQLKPLQPLGGVVAPGSSTPVPQPISVESLDTEHFVVVTREPRLVQQIGQETAAQGMLLTVVTHYTVRPDRLVPVEHVRVPAGYRLVVVGE